MRHHMQATAQWHFQLSELLSRNGESNQHVASFGGFSPYLECKVHDTEEFGDWDEVVSSCMRSNKRKLRLSILSPQVPSHMQSNRQNHIFMRERKRLRTPKLES